MRDEMCKKRGNFFPLLVEAFCLTESVRLDNLLFLLDFE